jgi:hypothetical protein
MNCLSVRSIVLIFAAMVAAGPAAQAVCSIASLTGTYAITSVGLNTAGQPAASLRQITANGKGSITGSSTRSNNGVITSLTLTGKYTLAASCIGTVTLTNSDHTIEHHKIILNNGNLGAFLIQTDNKETQSSIAVAKGAATCTDLGVKKIYSAQAAGTVLGTGGIAVVGQITLNGKGALTGSATYSADGAISSKTVTGTYLINSNCTGSAALTLPGLAKMNVALVVVNGGKEIVLIQTDADSIVTGSFQL